ncbi:uncharacterized protein LOC133633437 [Entelurus aequoreus]|uniref:uncharacterized protein LOC133633437 n=1 Tax=Entelurus aequoreus TaxID=161455 RepID=UPI002B1D7332|nr:uncharacterized protein LOC133633437 [Entelurus aequoreus]
MSWKQTKDAQWEWNRAASVCVQESGEWHSSAHNSHHALLPLLRPAHTLSDSSKTTPTNLHQQLRRRMDVFDRLSPFISRVSASSKEEGPPHPPSSRWSSLAAFSSPVMKKKVTSFPFDEKCHDKRSTSDSSFGSGSCSSTFVSDHVSQVSGRTPGLEKNNNKHSSKGPAKSSTVFSPAQTNTSPSDLLEPKPSYSRFAFPVKTEATPSAIFQSPRHHPSGNIQAETLEGAAFLDFSVASLSLRTTDISNMHRGRRSACSSHAAYEKMHSERTATLRVTPANPAEHLSSQPTRRRCLRDQKKTGRTTPEKNPALTTGAQMDVEDQVRRSCSVWNDQSSHGWTYRGDPNKTCMVHPLRHASADVHDPGLLDTSFTSAGIRDPGILDMSITPADVHDPGLLDMSFTSADVRDPGLLDMSFTSADVRDPGLLDMSFTSADVRDPGLLDMSFTSADVRDPGLLDMSFTSADVRDPGLLDMSFTSADIRDPGILDISFTSADVRDPGLLDMSFTSADVRDPGLLDMSFTPADVRDPGLLEMSFTSADVHDPGLLDMSFTSADVRDPGILDMSFTSADVRDPGLLDMSFTPADVRNPGLLDMSFTSADVRDPGLLDMSFTSADVRDPGLLDMSFTPADVRDPGILDMSFTSAKVRDPGLLDMSFTSADVRDPGLLDMSFTSADVRDPGILDMSFTSADVRDPGLLDMSFTSADVRDPGLLDTSQEHPFNLAKSSASPSRGRVEEHPYYYITLDDSDYEGKWRDRKGAWH